MSSLSRRPSHKSNKSSPNLNDLVRFQQHNALDANGKPALNMFRCSIDTPKQSYSNRHSLENSMVLANIHSFYNQTSPQSVSKRKISFTQDILQCRQIFLNNDDEEELDPDDKLDQLNSLVQKMTTRMNIVIEDEKQQINDHQKSVLLFDRESIHHKEVERLKERIEQLSMFIEEQNQKIYDLQLQNQNNNTRTQNFLSPPQTCKSVTMPRKYTFPSMNGNLNKTDFINGNLTDSLENPSIKLSQSQKNTQNNMTDSMENPLLKNTESIHQEDNNEDFQQHLSEFDMGKSLLADMDNSIIQQDPDYTNPYSYETKIFQKKLNEQNNDFVNVLQEQQQGNIYTLKLDQNQAQNIQHIAEQLNKQGHKKNIQIEIDDKQQQPNKFTYNTPNDKPQFNNLIQVTEQNEETLATEETPITNTQPKYLTTTRDKQGGNAISSDQDHNDRNERQYITIEEQVENPLVYNQQQKFIEQLQQEIEELKEENQGNNMKFQNIIQQQTEQINRQKIQFQEENDNLRQIIYDGESYIKVAEKNIQKWKLDHDTQLINISNKFEKRIEELKEENKQLNHQISVLKESNEKIIKESKKNVSSDQIDNFVEQQEKQLKKFDGNEKKDKGDQRKKVQEMYQKMLQKNAQDKQKQLQQQKQQNQNGYKTNHFSNFRQQNEGHKRLHDISGIQLEQHLSRQTSDGLQILKDINSKA